MFEKLVQVLKKPHRPFDSFQIEASTLSAVDCQICPRAVFAEDWIFQNMSPETFQGISRHFPLARVVSFRGWGEPLENENIVAMVQSAKEADCWTTLTTNGVVLTEDLSRKLIGARLDELVIFLELATQDIQENLRRSASDIGKTMAQLERFTALKKEMHQDKMRVNLSFPMTRLNIRELPGLISIAAKLRADEIIFTNLDYLPNERWNILRTFYHESPTEAFQQASTEMQQLAKKEGIQVKIYPLQAREVPVCEADPPRNVFVSVDGSVAPCPYLRLPKKGDIPRIFLNKEYCVPQTFFGNINQEDLLVIWEKRPYQRFREVFKKRRETEIDTARILTDFSNLSLAEREKAMKMEPPPALPEVCQTCYKAHGI
jgi:MoaA/NifB/PqqE/SkfB family radical SAM enzyme